MLKILPKPSCYTESSKYFHCQISLDWPFNTSYYQVCTILFVSTKFNVSDAMELNSNCFFCFFFVFVFVHNKV